MSWCLLLLSLCRYMDVLFILWESFAFKDILIKLCKMYALFELILSMSNHVNSFFFFPLFFFRFFLFIFFSRKFSCVILCQWLFEKLGFKPNDDIQVKSVDILNNFLCGSGVSFQPRILQYYLRWCYNMCLCAATHVLKGIECL